jgi:hypothetical protein
MASPWNGPPLTKRICAGFRRAEGIHRWILGIESGERRSSNDLYPSEVLPLTIDYSVQKFGGPVRQNGSWGIEYSNIYRPEDLYTDGADEIFVLQDRKTARPILP